MKTQLKSPVKKKDAEIPQFLSGGGEMARRIRDFDWASTSLGKPDKWSESLKSVVGLMLANRFPMLLWWGKDYVQFYNDPYIPIPGLKHPKALGQTAKECWQEIWNVIGPLVDTPFKGGPATWMDDILLKLNRNNFVEETHFIIAYSPVPDPKSPHGIGGVLATVNEITEEIIGKRQMETLRKLGKGISTTLSEDEVYAQATAVLHENLFDIPFALVHKIDMEGTSATLAATAGIAKDHPGVQMKINISDPDDSWEIFARTVNENSMFVWESPENLHDSPAGAWDIAPRSFAYLPIKGGKQKYPVAVVSVALNPYRKFDDSYRNFLQLIADQISFGASNAIAYEEEKKRTKILEELDRAKTIFFSNISHEFRTPLTLMLGTIEESLKAPETDPANVERMRVAHRNAMRLLRLVNTLLDFSRIESGRQQANYELTDIASLTKSLVGNFRSIMEKAGLELLVKTDPPRQPAYVDRQMWEKIVFNLLSNAFKYTLTGSITVRLSASSGHVVLQVSDTGIGIPEKELPRMFERFHRVENAMGRTYEGTGIGLSLTKELVQLHGGTIVVESEEGKGSTFIVSIPFEKEHLPSAQILERDNEFPSPVSDIFIEEAMSLFPKPAEPAATKNGNGLSGTLVLVVDDNADMRQHIKSLLEKHYTVLTASNGKEALQKIESHSPALVLSDIMMPVMNGTELLKEIKSNKQYVHLPVIFLTARAGEESKIEGLEMGADDYLVKPFSSNELLSRVKAQISISEKRKDTENKLEQKVTERTVELESAQSFLQQVIDSSVEFVSVLDKDLNYITVNRKFEQVMTVLREQIKGQNIFEMYPGVKGTIQHECILKALAGTIAHLEKQKSIARPEYLVDTYFVPLMINSHVEGVIIMARDVTDIARSEVILEEKNLELERINRELASFTYIASHDLQEPLRKIQTFTHLIKNGADLKQAADKYLEKIQTSAERMSRLISGVLTYSRLSQNSDVGVLTDLNKVVDNVIADFELLIEEKKATIECDTLPSVVAVPVSMHQLFSNLIGNSIKFSEKDPVIKITGRIVNGSEVKTNNKPDLRQKFAEIRFSDNGIGFEPEYKEQIFKLFQRLHNRTKYSGTGVGLSIVAKIVESHNGFINAESEENSGATFTVWLPVE